MKKTLFAALVIAACSILTFAQKPTPSQASQPFLLAVEDVFYIAGRGTVATGQIERGTLSTGDTIEIVGYGPTKSATVSGIEMFRRSLTEAKAGDNVGVLLRGVEKTDVQRGQVLAKPGSIRAFTKAKINFDLLTAAEGGRRTPIADGYRPQIMARTGSFSGTVTLLRGKTSVAPGDKGIEAEIELSEAAPLEKGQTIALREGGRNVGSATVLALIQ
jgi:elongation factor Tu